MCTYPMVVGNSPVVSCAAVINVCEAWAGSVLYKVCVVLSSV
jgi:hypothetical protein